MENASWANLKLLSNQHVNSHSLCLDHQLAGLVTSENVRVSSCSKLAERIKTYCQDFFYNPFNTCLHF